MGRPVEAMVRRVATSTRRAAVVAAAALITLSPPRFGCGAGAVEPGEGNGVDSRRVNDGSESEQHQQQFCDAEGNDCSDNDGFDTMHDCWTRALDGWCDASSPEESLLMSTHCRASCTRVRWVALTSV